MDSLQTHVTLDDKLKTALPTLRYRRAQTRVPRSEETRSSEAAWMQRSTSSYPAHEYGRNDRFTDSSHRRLPRREPTRREGFLKRKACLALSAPSPESQRDPECTLHVKSHLDCLRFTSATFSFPLSPPRLSSTFAVPRLCSRHRIL